LVWQIYTKKTSGCLNANKQVRYLQDKLHYLVCFYKNIPEYVYNTYVTLNVWPVRKIYRHGTGIHRYAGYCTLYSYSSSRFTLPSASQWCIIVIHWKAMINHRIWKTIPSETRYLQIYSVWCLLYNILYIIYPVHLSNSIYTFFFFSSYNSYDKISPVLSCRYLIFCSLENYKFTKLKYKICGNFKSCMNYAYKETKKYRYLDGFTKLIHNN